ncbi:MAG TPA: MGMT family protein [archaeon]|nr:MGMT family protein [archaeon]
MKSFNGKILALLLQIPRGKVTTYTALARAAGSPKAYRAAGNACNKNPNSPQVPCHRVVSSNGKIGGYARGTKRKIELLEGEGIKISEGKVVDFEKRLFSFE